MDVFAAETVSSMCAREGGQGTMITRQDDINLTDVHFFTTEAFHEVFKRMRADDPVHWTEGKLKRGFWSVFKHEDAYTVYRGSTEYFSSGRCSVSIPSSPEVEAVFDPEARGCGKMMLASDGDYHRDLRKAVNARFLPRSIKQYAEHGRRLATEILDNVLPRGHCDFVAEVAAVLPLAVICDMMEIPRDDWDMLAGHIKLAMGPEDAEYNSGGSAVETRQQGWKKVIEYARDLALQRRGGSGTDLLSALSAATVLGGRQLTEEEIGFNSFLFLLGGIESTRNAIAAGLLQLIHEPEQLARLRADRSLLPTAVEEILRWTTPILHSMRTAVKDTEIRGRRIREGDWVVVWIPSANRDEEVFANADRFDITREPNDHFSLVFGEHFCLGAHLARLEMRLLFSDLLDRMEDIELAGPTEWMASNIMHALKRMPITFRPRAVRR